MAKTKKTDKNKTIPKYLREEIEQNEYIESGGIGKRLLILVEGATEENYFNGIKTNPLLSESLKGVDIKLGGNLVNMVSTAIKEKANYEKIWFVCDNDKRNAFVLDDNFWDRLGDKTKAYSILKPTLEKAFDENKHAYFLSTYDYISWLSYVFSFELAMKFWDNIHHITAKNNDFEKWDDKNPYALFYKSEPFYNRKAEVYAINIDKAKGFDPDWKKYTKLAYSAIAFEFWLLLHFEKNKLPFIWVDKGKDVAIDVVEYLRQHYQENYVKGTVKEESSSPKSVLACYAYDCLKDDWKKHNITLVDERKILLKIIQAYRNAQWLKQEMKPILERQNGKWYEVNPYIEGLDLLILELLNIEKVDTEIDYFGWKIRFGFDKESSKLSVQIEEMKGNNSIINMNSKECFKILTIENEYTPIYIPNVTTMETTSLSIQYDTIPSRELENAVLRFQDPRTKSRSTKLLVLL